MRAGSGLCEGVGGFFLSFLNFAQLVTPFLFNFIERLLLLNLSINPVQNPGYNSLKHARNLTNKSIFHSAGNIPESSKISDN